MTARRFVKVAAWTVVGVAVAAAALAVLAEWVGRSATL
jgi:hypothetical protein